MALTPEEKKYVERLISAGADNENVKFYLNKRRQEEAKMNAPKEQGILGKTAGFFQNIGAGAIQAGGELAVGLPGQISRLLPGDQSANPESFYNKTQNLLDYSKKQFEKQGVETQGAGFATGKGIMNVAGGSVLGGGAGQLANKSKLLANLGLKTAAPSSFLGKTGAGVLQGAKTGGFMDLASGKAPSKGVIAGGVIGGALPTLGVLASLAGKGVQKSGAALYKTAVKPNVQEAEQIIKATARKTAMPTTRADTALKYGLAGTEKSLGVKGVREADKIFQKTIAPALEKSKAQHNIDDLLGAVEKEIQGTKSALRKDELMEGLQALKDDFIRTGKKIFTSGDLQAEKTVLDTFTPSKIFKGKDVAQGYTQAKAMLADVMRKQVRDDLGKAGVKNAKELYRDWANLMELEKVGVKGITEGGLKGGFGTFWSTLYDAVLTPVKTVGGKTLYKVGKGIEFTGPKGIKTLGQYLRSKGYTIGEDNLLKYANDTLVRGGVLSDRSNSGMDRNSLK